MELFVDATQCARMPVLLVKPCSTGTHWRCLIVKILLGEGLEIFRFFSCPEDVYHTLCTSLQPGMKLDVKTFLQAILYFQKIIAPQKIFICLMYLHHNLQPDRLIISFCFQTFLPFVPIEYSCLSSFAPLFVCIFILGNYVWEDLNGSWGSRIKWHLIHLGGFKFSWKTILWMTINCRLYMGSLCPYIFLAIPPPPPPRSIGIFPNLCRNIF